MDEGGLCISRGNGKTTLCAAIARACLEDEGPLVQPRAEVMLTASSFPQATIADGHVRALSAQDGSDSPVSEFFFLGIARGHARILPSTSGLKLWHCRLFLHERLWCFHPEAVP